MEGALRDLLGIRAVNLRNNVVETDFHDFKSLGVALSIPDLEIHTGEVFIWYAPAGLLPITRSEIIRFGMDAPSGFNLIFSERQVHSDCHSVDTFDFQIIGPEQISKWIGKAVLTGDLIATSSRAPEDQERTGLNAYNPTDKSILVLKPMIDINSWSIQRGMDGFSSSPILLTALIWTISGELIGPNGEGEMGEWKILEDPWSLTLSLLDSSEDFARAPMLRTVEPSQNNWLSEERLTEEIAQLIEERRRENSGETSLSGTVRSMLLKKWSLNFDSAIISSGKMLIPGWAIDTESEKILHGRNGRLYNL
jgi:hypothetical protein